MLMQNITNKLLGCQVVGEWLRIKFNTTLLNNKNVQLKLILVTHRLLCYHSI